MSVPSLCIHLDDDGNKKFEFNKEEHLCKPILATHCVDSLFGKDNKPFEDKEDVYNIN